MSAWAALGGVAGYALGGVPGALIGSSIGGGIDANKQRADIAESANAFSANQYATRYQTQVKDMEAAGLNPMLAYMQSPGASPQGQQYQITNPYESAARDYSSAYNVMRQGENIEADTELKSANIRLTEAQVEQVNKSVDKISAEIRNLDTDNERLKALIDNLREERQNLIKQNWNLTETGNMLRATTEKLKAEVPQLQSRTFLNYAQETLVKLESQLKQFDINAAKQFDNFGREAKELKPVVEIFKMLISTFTPRSGGITINK